MKQVRQVTTDRALMAKYRKYRKQAEQMVAEDWAMIEKLAFALYERKRPEREDIEEILGIEIGSGHPGLALDNPPTEKQLVTLRP
jgi:hypothetical protein